MDEAHNVLERYKKADELEKEVKILKDQKKEVDDKVRQLSNDSYRIYLKYHNLENRIVRLKRGESDEESDGKEPEKFFGHLSCR